MLNHSDIIKLTEDYGGGWAIEHSRRLLHTISIIGEGMTCDSEILFLAAYLHDWGGYAKWAVAGVDHHLRSKEVAAQFLRENGYPEKQTERILECIEFHHGGPANRSIESRLFTDADALDLLGVVGTLRVFAMNHRNIKQGYEAVKRWRDMSVAAISLEPSKKIAEKRLHETNDLLRQFEEETYGMF